MKKPFRKLTLNKELLYSLSTAQMRPAWAAAATGACPRTTEQTWYCPTASGCTNCGLCN